MVKLLPMAYQGHHGNPKTTSLTPWQHCKETKTESQTKMLDLDLEPGSSGGLVVTRDPLLCLSSVFVGDKRTSKRHFKSSFGEEKLSWSITKVFGALGLHSLHSAQEWKVFSQILWRETLGERRPTPSCLDVLCVCTKQIVSVRRTSLQNLGKF